MTDLMPHGERLSGDDTHATPAWLSQRRSADLLTTSRLPILMYHRVSDQVLPSLARYTVSPEAFEQQMAFLGESGYQALTASQAATAIRNRSIPQRSVVITFDDGFAEFRSAALPILERFGFPATLYVTSGYVGRCASWLGGTGAACPPMLDWPELNGLSRRGVEFGGHTQSHVALDTLPPSEVRHQLTVDRALLQNHIGCPVPTFAYPYGYSTPLVRRLVREAGYACACSVDFAPAALDDDLFALPRLVAPTAFAAGSFAALLRGPASRTQLIYRRARASLWHQIRGRVGRLRRGWWRGVLAA